MTVHELIHSALAIRLGYMLIHSIWQGSLIYILVNVALLIFKQSTPAARYSVIAIGMMLFFFAPFLTFCLLASSPIDRTVVLSRPDIASQTTRINFSPDTSQTNLQPIAQTSPNLSSPYIEKCLPYAVLAWLAGVTVLSIRHIGALVALQRLRVVSVKVPTDEIQQTLMRLAKQLRIRQRVRILISSRIDVPMLIGALRPLILLPPAILSGLSAQEVEAILAHELAHVCRHDYIVLLLQTVAETMLFYHPCIWWLSHRLSLEREQSCDDLALTVCGDRKLYAGTLLAIQELRIGAPVLPVTGNRAGELMLRVTRLLGLELPRRPGATRKMCSALMLNAILVAALATQLIRPAAASPPEPRTAWGSITTASGTVAKDIAVTAYVVKISHVSSAADVLQAVGSTKTDAQGRFEIHSAQIPTHIVASGDNETPTTVAIKSGAIPTDVRLRPDAVLRATFVDSHGQMVSGLKVRLASTVGFGRPSPTDCLTLAIQAKRTWMTDDQGVCVIDGLPLGEQIRLQLDDNRFAQLKPSAGTVLIAQRKVIAGFDLETPSPIAPSGSHEALAQPIGIQSPAPATDPSAKSITGRVTDENDRPVRAYVTFTPIFNEFGDPAGGAGRVASDASGNFKLKNAVGEYQLRCDAKDRATGVIRVTLKAVEATAGDDNVIVHVTRAAVPLFKGRVVNSAGEPLSGIAVLFSLRFPTAQGREVDIMGAVGNTQTDDDGYYSLVGSFPDLPTKIWASGMSVYSPESSELIAVHPGEVNKVPDIVLKKPDGFVAGRVVDPDGKPLPDVRVSEMSFESSAVTTSDGRFRIENVPDGRLELHIKSPAWQAAPIWPVKGSTDNLIVAQPRPQPTTATKPSP
jgi:beta-lactamase regulating signal transducer with metallopeptidase domain